MAQTKKKNRRKVRRQGLFHGAKPQQKYYGGGGYAEAVAAWEAAKAAHEAGWNPTNGGGGSGGSGSGGSGTEDPPKNPPNLDTDGDGTPDRFDPAVGAQSPTPVTELPESATITPERITTPQGELVDDPATSELQNTEVVGMRTTDEEGKPIVTPVVVPEFGPEASQPRTQTQTSVSPEEYQRIQDGGTRIIVNPANGQTMEVLAEDPRIKGKSDAEIFAEMGTGSEGTGSGRAFSNLLGTVKQTTSGAVDTQPAPMVMPPDPSEADAPTDVSANTYDAVTVSDDVTEAKAAEGTLSEGATAQLDDKELTEKAVAATRDTTQEQAALAGQTQFTISNGSYVNKVTGDVTDVAPTAEAERNERERITGTKADEGQAAEIVEKVGYEAALARQVKGTAAKGGAAEMIAAVGELPPNISEALVQNPAIVEAQVDNEPVEVRAAIAALPTEALVSAQMETLLGGIEDGEVPVWARPAVDLVNRQMTMRGLKASTVGRDALFNSIIQSAMPIAQSNAQALQQRAAQNLSNQQQATIQQSNVDAQRRLQNVSNSQTAASQTAQMAQQMSTLQSQFAQDAVITSAAQQQQLRVQNLQNRQQTAIQNVQNLQASNAQNLGNEQQTELANLQFEFQTNAANMSAENQSRLVEMQTAADFLSKNEGFKQQMELANLSNDQQMRLANLTALSQAASDQLTADQQTELANLDSRMKTNILQAEIANKMNVAQLSVDQQRAVQNASMVANIDLTKFNADQQVELTNSKFMQTMTLTDFNAEQQSVILNATNMAALDQANLNVQAKLASQNAQSFLQMDLSNLNNKQQANMLTAQMQQQALLSDQSMQNAAEQFNATSQNQVDQFNENLASQINQFNAAQANNMTQARERIDSGETIANAQLQLQAGQFNADQEFRREQFNAANAQAIAQADIAWRRNLTTAENAAQNAANQQNAQNSFNMTIQQQQNVWQEARDQANYLRQQYENEETRKTQLYAVALGNETAAGKDSDSTITELVGTIDDIINN